MALWQFVALKWVKLSNQPKEAPVAKPSKDMFDPKLFLAKVGAESTC